MWVVTREVDQWVQIGESIFVAPTDIDAGGVRLIARGRMLGGADDGATFTRTAELGVAGEMRIGPHVAVTIVEIRADAVRLGIHVPPHIEVRRVDAIKHKPQQ
jgi:sRNA-binding carbon storage regulator CsrA